MSTADKLRPVSSTVLSSTTDALNDLSRIGPKIIDGLAQIASSGNPVNRLTAQIGAAAAKKALSECIDLARDIMQALHDLNERGGDPDRLRLQANTLRKRVSTPLEMMHPRVLPKSLSAMVPSVWHDGDAHAVYANSFAGQGEAVASAVAAGRAVAGSLDSMADGIDDYYLQLCIEIVMLASAVLTFIAGVIAAEGLVGVVAAIAAGIVAFGSGLAMAGTLLISRGDPVGDAVGTLVWPTPAFSDN